MLLAVFRPHPYSPAPAVRMTVHSHRSLSIPLLLAWTSPSLDSSETASPVPKIIFVFALHDRCFGTVNSPDCSAGGVDAANDGPLLAG